MNDGNRPTKGSAVSRLVAFRSERIILHGMSIRLPAPVFIGETAKVYGQSATIRTLRRYPCGESPVAIRKTR